MMRIAIATFLTLFLLSVTTPLQAQADTAPPYLYYYSRLLGGLIIERADGTDSRRIGEDVFPATGTGIGGPGWSPSGKYFAAYPETYGGFSSAAGNTSVIDVSGLSIASWLGDIPLTLAWQWSPSGEDILLVSGNFRGRPLTNNRGTFLWLIDVENDRVLSSFGLDVGSMAYEMSEITWDVPNGQISFYLAPETYEDGNYYRVTMYFDGTTIREPVSGELFVSRAESLNLGVSPENWQDGQTISPSGTYEISGYYPPILTNTHTGTQIELPLHTQETGCREYLWSGDEQYVITLSGTLISGGGCSAAVIGVADIQGELWRELGTCSWDISACVGWLPENVDINSLPPGSPNPIQLSPVRIEYEDEPVFIIGVLDIPYSRMLCGEDSTAEIIEDATGLAAYTLAKMECPYGPHDTYAEHGIQTVTAYSPEDNLLATFTGRREDGVTVWLREGEVFTPALRLNTQGFDLEFTDDGEFLRARNVNGWQVYSVADILEYAARSDA